MWNVFSQCGGLICVKKHLRHWLNVRSVERVELFNVGEDMAEIVRHAGHFFVGETEVSQIGYVAYVFFR